MSPVPFLFFHLPIFVPDQEYALDKINRKMHLSKLKHSKFNESGQLLAFYLISLAWGIDILVTEGYIWDLTSLWNGLVLLRFKPDCSCFFCFRVVFLPFVFSEGGGLYSVSIFLFPFHTKVPKEPRVAAVHIQVFLRNANSLLAPLFSRTVFSKSQKRRTLRPRTIRRLILR